MLIRTITVSLLATAACCAAMLQNESKAGGDSQKEVAAILDNWHDAAAKADEERYFGHMTAESIFLGTDATERWNKKEFQDFAHPFFAKGKAWSFKSVARHIYFSDDGRTAWFDEELDTPNLGPSRGSGVLVRKAEGWKIAHYNLTIPIPNDIMKDVKKMIDNMPKGKK